jgi:hypothetical protein
MLELFKNKENYGKCSICNQTLNPNENIVVVEFKIIPPVVFFFHLLHYKDYLELLKNYIKEKEEYYYERFISINKGELIEEGKIAENLGFEEDFRRDLRDIVNYMVYKILKREKKEKFFCHTFKELRGIKGCFECTLLRNYKCSKQFIYSIRMEIDKYRSNKERY